MRFVPLAIVTSSFLALPAFAQETIDLGRVSPESPEEVPGEDLQPEEPVRAWITPDPLAPVIAPYRSAQEALAEHNFDLTLSATIVYQHATEVFPDTDRNWVTGNFQARGYWNLFQDERLGGGSLGFLIEGGDVFDHSDDFELSSNVGSLSYLNYARNWDDIAVSELWYEHILSDNWTLTVGKLDPTYYYDFNAVANYETTMFLASPLVSNASIPFPDRGLGANLWWTVNDKWYVEAGVQDARGTTGEAGFDTVDEGDLFSAVEVGVAPGFAFGEGTYRVTGWRSEFDDAEGFGVGVSFDQQLGAESPLIAFFRAGLGDDDVAYNERSFSAGLGVVDPLGRADDMLAFGWAWAKPSDDAMESEHLFELFYRMQLTETIGITPDVQFIPNPSDPDQDHSVFLFALRVQATF